MTRVPHPRDLPPMSTWTGQAACAEIDPEVFFPGRDNPYGWHATSLAKQVCAGCPVIDQCREYALAHTRVPLGYVDGIWGGLTRDERRQLLAGTPPLCANCTSERPGNATYCPRCRRERDTRRQAQRRQRQGWVA